MKHKGWKISGSLLLCAAVSVSIWISCILVQAGAGGFASSEENDSKPSECFVESSLADSLPVECEASSYEWDFQKGYPVFDGKYDCRILIAFKMGFASNKLQAFPVGGTVDEEVCLHPVIVTMGVLSDQEKERWESLVVSWGLSGEVWPNAHMLCYHMLLSFSDIKQLYELAKDEGYEVWFEPDPKFVLPESFQCSNPYLRSESTDT